MIPFHYDPTYITTRHSGVVILVLSPRAKSSCQVLEERMEERMEEGMQPEYHLTMVLYTLAESFKLLINESTALCFKL